MIKKVTAVFLVIAIFLSFLLVPVACAPTEEEEMGMDDAINVVVEEILPNIPEIQEENPYWCLKLDSSLSEGTVIEEDSGEEDSGDTLGLTLGEETFFFYLDLAPGAFYEHPVKYILVDTNGNHEEFDAKWWPRINNEVPDVFKPAVPDDLYVIATNVPLTERIASPAFYEFIEWMLEHREGFIVVQGLRSDAIWYDCATDDYQNRIDFFNAYALPLYTFSEVKGLVEEQAANVLTEIDNMVADGLNPITISIFAHGGTNYVGEGYIRLYDTYVSANEFRSKMAQYPNTTFNVMITSCHSGSFIDELETLDNVCVVVTACRADESAWPDYDVNDVNPADSGGEWTSSIVETMAEIVDNLVYRSDIQALAAYYNVSTTCVLISEAYWGALGNRPAFGMTQDLDICHHNGWETPQIYCSFP